MYLISFSSNHVSGNAISFDEERSLHRSFNGSSLPSDVNLEVNL